MSKYAFIWNCKELLETRGEEEVRKWTWHEIECRRVDKLFLKDDPLRVEKEASLAADRAVKYAISPGLADTLVEYENEGKWEELLRLFNVDGRGVPDVPKTRFEGAW